MYTHILIYMHACVHTYTYTYTHIHAYAYMYIYIYIYIMYIHRCIYIYIYMYTYVMQKHEDKLHNNHHRYISSPGGILIHASKQRTHTHTHTHSTDIPASKIKLTIDISHLQEGFSYILCADASAAAALFYRNSR
jgi:hypothetical protein